MGKREKGQGYFTRLFEGVFDIKRNLMIQTIPKNMVLRSFDLCKIHRNKSVVCQVNTFV